MEAYITHTVSLHSSAGVVHIQGVTLDPKEGYVYLEFDAQQLLADIPSLYRLCKQALDQEAKYTKEKYKEFHKQINSDLKKKRV